MAPQSSTVGQRSTRHNHCYTVAPSKPSDGRRAGGQGAGDYGNVHRLLPYDRRVRPREPGAVACRGAHGPAGKVHAELVVDLPGRLPAGTTIVGSYAPAVTGAVFGEGTPPSVMIVEADDPTSLGFIGNYYAGYLIFQWMPATVVGGDPQRRAAWRQEAEAQTAAVRG